MISHFPYILLGKSNPVISSVPKIYSVLTLSGSSEWVVVDALLSGSDLTVSCDALLFIDLELTLNSHTTIMSITN